MPAASQSLYRIAVSASITDSSDVIATLIMPNFPLYLIQLWWQFFPNPCLWRRSLCSNLAGIDSKKLYRATFICQYGLFCCMALVSFRLFHKNLGNLQEFFGQMDYRPPWQKIARTPMLLTAFRGNDFALRFSIERIMLLRDSDHPRLL